MSTFASGSLRHRRSRGPRDLARLARRGAVAASAVAVGVALSILSSHIGTALAHAPRATTPAEAMRLLQQPRGLISHPADLDAFARAFRHAPVTVTCVTSRTRWLQLVDTRVLGYVRSRDRLRVVLGPEVCQVAAKIFANPGVVSVDRAVALQVIVHELVHTTGLVDERQAERISFTLLRSTLVRFFGYSRTDAMAMDRDAWSYHLGRSAAYQLPGVRRYTPWPE